MVVADEVEEALEPSSHRGKLVGSQSARLSSHRARVVSANRCRDHLETCRYVTKLAFVIQYREGRKDIYLTVVTSGFIVEKQIREGGGRSQIRGSRQR